MFFAQLAIVAAVLLGATVDADPSALPCTREATVGSPKIMGIEITVSAVSFLLVASGCALHHLFQRSRQNPRQQLIILHVLDTHTHTHTQTPRPMQATAKLKRGTTTLGDPLLPTLGRFANHWCSFYHLHLLSLFFHGCRRRLTRPQRARLVDRCLSRSCAYCKEAVCGALSGPHSTCMRVRRQEWLPADPLLHPPLAPGPRFQIAAPRSSRARSSPWTSAPPPAQSGLPT